jgi:hypothetical protein
MIVEHKIAFTKTQIKMMDCWYACIQMLCSSEAGSKTKPKGPAAKAHRAPFFVAGMIGQKLDFLSDAGTAIMNENGLIDISNNIDTNDIATLATNLQTYGPIIAGGTFGMNRCGHFIVISGCDTATGCVSIYDPAWGMGKDTKPWTYVDERSWGSMGSLGAFIAHDSDDFFNQPTRARR